MRLEERKESILNDRVRQKDMKENARYNDKSPQWEVFFGENSDKILSRRQKANLISEALDMFGSRESEREIKTDSLEGRVRTNGKYYVLGSFAGQHYEAEVETDWGKAKLSFLVKEYVDPAKN
jgi:hypothetical protein